jgi:hypothetical protein
MTARLADRPLTHGLRPFVHLARADVAAGAQAPGMQLVRPVMRRRVAIAIANADAVILVCFGVLHASGGRASVGVLSGSFGSGLEVPVGLAYVIAWFGVVLVVPITLLALLLDTMCVRILARWHRSRRP